ncbi:MAG: hypothetical protein HYV78_02415 [Candidatus Wildermuthbacteria bacterium]|nr:hypothetical protein [Candidatus Wildermuthbacteria bacterium]
MISVTEWGPLLNGGIGCQIVKWAYAHHPEWLLFSTEAIQIHPHLWHFLASVKKYRDEIIRDLSLLPEDMNVFLGSFFPTFERCLEVVREASEQGKKDAERRRRASALSMEERERLMKMFRTPLM